MKTIASWESLRAYGINALTGEACSLMYRILCDITEDGKRVIEKSLSCELKPPENWNAGAVGSIMLAPEMLVPISVFALLEAGCRECYVIGDAVVGIEQSDSDADVERLLHVHQDAVRRHFAYHGPHGDRNLHQMSGRVV
jgi:hypothetical protein